jgi:hypothetical protein
MSSERLAGRFEAPNEKQQWHDAIVSHPMMRKQSMKANRLH